MSATQKSFRKPPLKPMDKAQNKQALSLAQTGAVRKQRPGKNFAKKQAHPSDGPNETSSLAERQLTKSSYRVETGDDVIPFDKDAFYKPDCSAKVQKLSFAQEADQDVNIQQQEE